MQQFLKHCSRAILFSFLLCIMAEPLVAAPAEVSPGLYAMYCWPSNYIRYADDIRENGFRWVRMGGFGNDAEVTDQAVLLAAKNHTHIAPTLYLRNLSHDKTIPVDEAVEEFRKSVRHTVSRYGPGGSLWREHPQVEAVPIRYWGIWNEPNIEFLTPPDDSILRTDLYAKLLQAASEEIRAIDPGAKIIAFNTAGGVPYRGRGIPPDGMWQKLKYIGWRKFISDVVAITGTACFDIVATHPYTMPLGPDEGRVVEGVSMLEEIAKKQGFADKPVWFTEVGYPIEYPRQQNVRDERQQACFTTRLLAMAAAHGVEQVQIMYVEDIVYGPDQTQRSFGFYPTPGQWREQAKAVQIMVRLLPDPRDNSTIIREQKDGVWAYQFNGVDGKLIIMAWHTGSGRIRESFETNATVMTQVDMLGSMQELTIQNGQVTVELTEKPSYLVPADIVTTKQLLGDIRKPAE